MKQILVNRNNSKRIIWTDEDPKIKKGNSIRFKDEKEFWDIEKVFDISVEKKEINRSWNVGGL